MGMKQRLGIANALLGNSDLIILDEPTNGLDPNGMEEINELIIYLAKTFQKTFYILPSSSRDGRDMQCKIEIDDMEGTFPTITPFGMAALLPNIRLQTEIRNNNLKVLIDGESTDMPNRQKVLQKANKNSRVFKYDDLIHMKREERKAEVKERYGSCLYLS